MIRKIIKIDDNKCNGCGACVVACHEGAIKLIDGKAKLIREDYCDGLGDCLPSCPVDAITFEEREALEYNEAEVMKAKQETLACGCPGTHAKSINRNIKINTTSTITPTISQLSQWPVQIKLVPINAKYFNNANLLIAADCTAYAYANFHNEFIKKHVTLIGCPKLDNEDYSIKLSKIITNNNINSITVIRMEVPCCSGIANSVKKALFSSNKLLPLKIVTISTTGEIVNYE